MNDIRSKALKEQQELRERLAELDAFLAVYDRLASPNSEQEEHLAPVKSGETNVPAPRRKRRKITPAELADEVEKVIRAKYRPFTRGQLVEQLAERGIEVPSADAARYLGTVLWRQKDRFENREGEGYWLRGLPYPQTLSAGGSAAIVSGSTGLGYAGGGTGSLFRGGGTGG